MHFDLDDFANAPSALGNCLLPLIFEPYSDGCLRVDKRHDLQPHRKARTLAAGEPGYGPLLQQLLDATFTTSAADLERTTEIAAFERLLPDGEPLRAIAARGRPETPGILKIVLALGPVFVVDNGMSKINGWYCRPRDTSGFLVPDFGALRRLGPLSTHEELLAVRRQEPLSAHEELEAPFHPRFGPYNIAALLAALYCDINPHDPCLKASRLPQKLLDLWGSVRSWAPFPEGNRARIEAKIDEIARIHRKLLARLEREIGPGWKKDPELVPLIRMEELLEIYRRLPSVASR